MLVAAVLLLALAALGDPTPAELRDQVVELQRLDAAARSAAIERLDETRAHWLTWHSDQMRLGRADAGGLSEAQILEVQLAVSERFEKPIHQILAADRLATLYELSGRLVAARDLLVAQLARLEDDPQAVRLRLALCEAWRLLDEKPEETLALLHRADGELDASAPDHAWVRVRRLGEEMELWTAAGLVDRARPLAKQLDDLVEQAPATAPAAAVYRLNYLQAARRAAEAVALADETLAALPRNEPDLESSIRWRRALALAIAARDGDADALASAQGALRAAADDPRLAFSDGIRALAELARTCSDAHDHAGAAAAIAEAEQRVAERNGDAGTTLNERVRLGAEKARLAIVSGATPSERAAVASACEAVYAELLDAWARRPPRKGGLSFLRFTSRRELLPELIELHRTETDGTVRAFDLVLQADALGSLARTLGCTKASLADVRGILLQGDDHGALVFLPGPRLSHLFALDRARLLCLPLPAETSLAAAARELMPLVTHPLGDAERETLRERRAALAAMLLPPEALSAIERWSRVTIVGLHDFGQPPFEALARAGSAPFGETLAIDYAPSLALGIALARSSAIAPLRALLVAAPALGAELRKGHPTLGEISWDDAAADACGAPFGAAQRRLIGPAATIAALAAEDATSCALWQFVAHGVNDLERERYAALALAPDVAHPDGLLRCDDVEALSAPPLVELWSCGSALGPQRLGDDGIQHLGGAFLAAGARAVIVAAADLEYRASLELSRRFHESLVTGVSIAEALRVARASLAAEDGFEDPCHHSLAVLVGFGQTPLFAPSPTAAKPSRALAFFEQHDAHLVLGAGGLALLALVAWLALRRRS